MEIKTKLNLQDKFYVIKDSDIKEYTVNSISIMVTADDINPYFPKTFIYYNGYDMNFEEDNVFANKEELKKYIDSKEF